ncbi:hypothetical protein [Crenothrix polyspora]|uniref:Uncharacterized protein n=1 Tax=Crenothrix polyspora TaxID=360316 RepID=A0A1R4HFW3_9GAMM|nr:hypothetical protein [Crenothrix polyspora]SJM95123.1 conserved exported hypothetical protein [Crenothrix polyspora]
MKFQNILTVILLLAASSSVFAYGGSPQSSARACSKPKFSHFTPVDKAEVAANATFSFSASAQTNPDSISVSIKDHVIGINITPKNSGFDVTGTIPESAKNSFVRIKIAAEGANGCKGTDGWLLKVLP